METKIKKLYNKKHGMAKSSEYTAWRNAKSRYLDPKNPYYKNYGKRGIIFYQQWINDFSAFLKEVGLKPNKNVDLDRIDNDKGYEPGNLRWVSRKENLNNRKRKCPNCGYKCA